MFSLIQRNLDALIENCLHTHTHTYRENKKMITYFGTKQNIEFGVRYLIFPSFQFSFSSVKYN